MRLACEIFADLSCAGSTTLVELARASLARRSLGVGGAIANFSLSDKSNDRDYTFAVSASEIIKELPKLSEAERRAVLNKLRELAARAKMLDCASKWPTNRLRNSTA